jgi:hypothetical protein
LITRIQEQWQADVAIVDLFKEPTLAQLAAAITRTRASNAATACARTRARRRPPRCRADAGALGITHVYGVPGQPVYGTFAACAQAGCGRSAHAISWAPR